MEVIDKKLTVEDFFELELPDEATHYFELLNGMLVRKNAPSGGHQFAQSEIFGRLFTYVSEKNLGRVFGSPTAVVLSEFDAPQPDILFLAKENMGKFDTEWGVKGAPDLIVEIVSPSSFRYDRFDKKDLYARHGVREYWLVDPTYKSIEIFSLKENGKYEIHAFGVEDESITSLVLEGFEMKMEGVFAP